MWQPRLFISVHSCAKDGRRVSSLDACRLFLLISFASLIARTTAAFSSTDRPVWFLSGRHTFALTRNAEPGEAVGAAEENTKRRGGYRR